VRSINLLTYLLIIPQAITILTDGVSVLCTHAVGDNDKIAMLPMHAALAAGGSGKLRTLIR